MWLIVLAMQEENVSFVNKVAERCNICLWMVILHQHVNTLSRYSLSPPSNSVCNVLDQMLMWSLPTGEETRPKLIIISDDVSVSASSHAPLSMQLQARDVTPGQSAACLEAVTSCGQGEGQQCMSLEGLWRWWGEDKIRRMLTHTACITVSQLCPGTIHHHTLAPLALPQGPHTSPPPPHPTHVLPEFVCIFHTSLPNRFYRQLELA